MSLEKNKKKAKQMVVNEKKNQNADRNKRVKDYIEMKMLKGYTREEASHMAQALIDNQMR
jgi:hypothetical protein|tara:strand:+ start:369 stop:548 length:180 start_codon:yes stop_codon:yes gene_type:complete